jgi:hypothetical protein
VTTEQEKTIMSDDTQDQQLADAARAALPALILLGDYIGNTFDGKTGIPAFDRCAIIMNIRAALGEAGDAGDERGDEQQPLTSAWLKEFSRPRGTAAARDDSRPPAPPFSSYPSPVDLRFPPPAGSGEQDERYGADGQPLPRGRCDTCGAPCSPDEDTCTADPAHQTVLTGDEDEDAYEGIDASMAKEDRRNAWQEGDDEDDGEYLPGTFVRAGHPGDVNDPERYPDEPLTGDESPAAEF